MDEMRALGAVRRRGRRGGGMMCGVMGLNRGGLGGGRRAVATVAAKERRRRYLRAISLTSGALSMVAPVFAEALVRRSQGVAGASGVCAHG